MIANLSAIQFFSRRSTTVHCDPLEAFWRFIDHPRILRKAATSARYTLRLGKHADDACRTISVHHSARPRRRAFGIPVRVFHWLLVALIVVSFTTAADRRQRAMRIHELSGFSILTLVLFRVLWGIFGSTYARFSDFVRHLRQAIEYARSLRRGRSPFYAGHNPLGVDDRGSCCCACWSRPEPGCLPTMTS